MKPIPSRVVVFFLIILAALPAGGDNTLSRNAVTARLAEAETLAIRGDADAAMDAYGSLIDDGVDTAGIRYNLGTLALRAGDPGRAALHLLAASKLAPQDEDVAFNLDLARQMRVDQVMDVEGTGPSLGQRVLLLSPRLLEGAHLVFALLGFLGLAFFPFSPRGRRILALAAILCGTLAVLIGGLAHLRQTEVERKWAVILAEETAARDGPSTRAATSFSAHAGLFGEVIDMRDNMIRVRLENGVDAWLLGDDVGVVQLKGN
jgi:hypothetical protein